MDRIKSLVGDGLVSTWEHTGYSEGSGVGCGGCRGLVPGTGAAAWWGLRRGWAPFWTGCVGVLGPPIDVQQATGG